MATATPAISWSAERAARIERLRRVVAQLEQSPPSGQRDTVLRAVRERVVTLDTGSQHSSAWRSKPDVRPENLGLGLLEN